MSEARELVDELKDRFLAWRLRTQSRGESPDLESAQDDPDIEFTPLDPFAPGLSAAPRTFAALTPAWIAQQCAPAIFAQGQQIITAKQVTRVHVLNARMTGTTQGRHFDDQEILFRDGVLVATCTCQQRGASPTMPPSASTQSAPASPAITPADGSDLSARTLSCSHVVAILLAYLQKTTPSAANSSAPPSAPRSPLPAQGKLVCPVTRQPLQPDRPLLQCQRCGICYSEAGWQFLRKEARGHCCGCDGRNTVK